MIIARIRLTQGNAGWFDPSTNICLSISNPYADIESYMPVENIKRGLKYGTITLVSGSVEMPPIVQDSPFISEPKEVVQEEQVIEVQEMAIVDEIEEVEELEEVKEVKPKKRSSKK